MKNITRYIILLFLIFSLTGPAYGFAGMGNGNFITQPDANDTSLENITDSDKDLLLLQHLIEIDTEQLRSENRIFVRETLSYKNFGTMNFSGSIRTWVPDFAENMAIARVEMVAGAMPRQLGITQNGNIISWQDFLSTEGIPPLYILQYVVPAGPEGTFSSSDLISKRFLYPTLITKKPFSIIIKITTGEEESIEIIDENGNNILDSGNPTEEEPGSMLYGWEQPEFNDLNIKITRSTFDVQKILVYLIPGILILLILFYPLIRSKSDTIQDFELKIRDLLKREEDEEEIEEEEIEEEIEEEPPEQPVPEESPQVTRETESTPGEGSPELEGEKGELEKEKNGILSKIEDLQKEYSSGNLLDEEYEELRETLDTELNKINERIKQL